MTRTIAGIGAVILSSAAVLSAPVDSTKSMTDVVVPPWGIKTFVAEYKGGERACAIAIGKKGESYLGLTAYDRDGNCVAWDEEGNAATPDDTAIDWFPGQTGQYTIEVRNFGLSPNSAKVVLR